MSLSNREIEIVGVIVKGYTIEETANDMCISSGTVRKHLNNVYKKLKVRNRLELFLKLQKLGIIVER